MSKNILIVDDVRLNQQQLQKFLEEKIFNEAKSKPFITVASNFAETRNRLSKHIFDIVMLDAELSDYNEPDGEFSFKLISEIKKNNLNAIIVMCSNSSDYNERGLSEGATTSLRKSAVNLPDSVFTELKKLLLK